MWEEKQNLGSRLLSVLDARGEDEIVDRRNAISWCYRISLAIEGRHGCAFGGSFDYLSEAIKSFDLKPNRLFTVIVLSVRSNRPADGRKTDHPQLATSGPEVGSRIRTRPTAIPFSKQTSSRVSRCLSSCCPVLRVTYCSRG